MVLLSTLQDLIYDVLFSISTPMPVIWQDQDGTRPNKPYLAIILNTLAKIGQDYIGRPNNTGANTISGNREMMLSIQCIGPGGMTILELISTSFQLESVKNALRAGGLVVIDNESIHNLTELEDTHWTERFQMDVQLRFAEELVDNIGMIKTVKDIDSLYKKGNTFVKEEFFTVQTN